MESQLTLIDADETNWGLDEHIKAVGRLGIARAREALRMAALASAHGAPTNEAGGDARGRTAA